MAGLPFVLAANSSCIRIFQYMFSLLIRDNFLYLSPDVQFEDLSTDSWSRRVTTGWPEDNNY